MMIDRNNVIAGPWVEYDDWVVLRDLARHYQWPQGTIIRIAILALLIHPEFIGLSRPLTSGEGMKLNNIYLPDAAYAEFKRLASKRGSVSALVRDAINLLLQSTDSNASVNLDTILDEIRIWMLDRDTWYIPGEEDHINDNYYNDV